MHWTAEQILKLAPDAASAKAAQGLLAPKKWTSLGVNETAIWGACQGSGSNPYQTQIDLGEPAFKCSCPSRKFPCKHGLALFLLFAEQPSLFAKTAPPDTVASWLKGRSDRAAKKDTAATAKSKDPKDPESQAKTAARRLDRVKDGALELQRWLEDMVRTGLAGNLSRGTAPWESQAARLVDAQAPGLARFLKEAAVLSTREGWQERLLEQMALLYLLLEGFRRSAALPEDLQDEVQSLIGWKQDQQELLQDVGIADQWKVMGQRTLLEDRLQVQRTWLKGTSTGREAMTLAFAYGNQAPVSGLIPGTCFDGELVFFPGRSGLRALVKTRSEATRQLQKLPGESIAHSVARIRARVRLIEPAGFTKISALGVEEKRVNVISDFIDPPDGLSDGYRVEARIVTWEGQNVLKIPGSAAFRVGETWSVFVIEGGRARRKMVQIEHRNQTEVEILRGLIAGKEVILHPSNELKDGIRVRAQ